MKKLFALLLVVGIALSSTAQHASLMPLKAGDTLTTSGSKDTVVKTITATAGYSALGVQVNVTKLSGTISAKAYLYGSLDGVNYNLTDSSSAFANQTTNVAWFTKQTTPYTYYQVHVRAADGSNTTQSAIVRVYYVFRKHSP
jgi:hypothetical protein